MPTVDLRARSVATLDVATDEALRLAGVSPRTIRRRVQQGHWTRPATGVVVLRPIDDPRQAMLVAMLAGPAWTTVSHRSAAFVHDLAGIGAPRVPEVTVPRGRRYVALPARVHTTIRPETSITAAGPLRITSVARTLRDLAGDPRLAPRVLHRAVREALGRGDVTVADVAAETEPRGRGRRRLREAIEAELDNAHHRIESPLEARWVDALLRVGLTGFVTQHRLDLEGRALRLDIAWPAARLAMEVDGARWHADALAAAADATRSSLLEQAGWRIVRVGAADLAPGRCEVVVTHVRRLLAATSSNAAISDRLA